MTYCPKCGKYNAWHCSNKNCVPCNEELEKAGGIVQIPRWKLWNIFIPENVFYFLWRTSWKLQNIFPKLHPYNYLHELLQCPFCGCIMSFESWEELSIDQFFEENGIHSFSELKNIK